MSARDFWLCKKTWLDAAELFDAWRAVPRIVLLGYGWLVWDMWQWVKHLPDLTTQQTAFVTVITGLAVPLTGWYMNTGRRWGKDGTTGASG
jgi:hypothetical protein